MPELIGTSAVMLEVYRRTRRAADSDASVLLLGETGTGKELIATALHRWSKRASGPMVKVNCGALADSLGRLEDVESIRTLTRPADRG